MMRLNSEKGDKPSSTTSILSSRRGNSSSNTTKKQQQQQQRKSSATTSAPASKPKGKKKTTFASSNETPAPPPKASKKSALKNATLSDDGSEEEKSPPVSSPFTQLELRDIQESFATFDIDGSGQIVVGELREVLQSLQIEQTQSSIVVYPYLDQVVAELESSYGDDDTLDINDYLQLMERTTLQHRMLSSLEASGNGSGSHDEDDSNNAKENNNYAYVFSLFDIDNKGYITVDDLERVATYLGEQDMTREELAEMIDRGRGPNGTGGGGAGDDGNDEGAAGEGRVTLEHFTNIMTTKLYRFSINDSAKNNNNDGSQEGEDEVEEHNDETDEAAT